MEWPSWLILAYTGRRAPRRRGRDRGCPVSGWGKRPVATPWIGSRGQPPWTPAYENISHSPPTIAAAATRAHPARASHHDGGRLNCLTRAIGGGRTGGCSRLEERGG